MFILTFSGGILSNNSQPQHPDRDMVVVVVYSVVVVVVAARKSDKSVGEVKGHRKKTEGLLLLCSPLSVSLLVEYSAMEDWQDHMATSFQNTYYLSIIYLLLSVSAATLFLSIHLSIPVLHERRWRRRRRRRRRRRKQRSR